MKYLAKPVTFMPRQAGEKISGYAGPTQSQKNSREKAQKAQTLFGFRAFCAVLRLFFSPSL